MNSGRNRGQSRNAWLLHGLVIGVIIGIFVFFLSRPPQQTPALTATAITASTLATPFPIAATATMVASSTQDGPYRLEIGQPAPEFTTAVQSPLLANCPVNLECQVRHTLRLPSHSLFVAEVVVMHADKAILTERREVDFTLAGRGLAYGAGVVRERPVADFRPLELLQKVRIWSSRA